MSNSTQAEAYVVEADLLAKLRSVMDALYVDGALTPDRRRDLANQMHALIGQIESQGLSPAQARELGI
jgi:hypothetical protein